MNRFDDLQQMIEANPDVAEFAPLGEGISEDWILRAEEALGFALPQTYQWWLRNYNGGEIGGEEIFSIYGEDFDTVVGGDIVAMHRLQANGNEHLVPICHSDIDGVFSFDRSKVNAAGEYPVVREADNSIYAKDFLEFLKKRIALILEL